MYITSDKEISNLSSRKKAYVRYRNKLKTDKKDWSSVTEEEFIKVYCSNSKGKFYSLIKWEKSQEYQLIVNKLTYETLNQDVMKVYEVVKEKALTGDDKAIKTLFMIKKEIESSIKTIEKSKRESEVIEIDEGDGLLL